MTIKITNLRNGLTKFIDATNYTMEDLEKTFKVYESTDTYKVQIQR